MKLLRQLNSDLAAAGQRSGRDLEWSAQERALLGLICDQTDRRSELYAEYRGTEDTKARVKLSAELRLLEGSISRLLKGVSTDVSGGAPRQYESQASRRAQHAALARWGRESGGTG